jgi:hypothetical protein
MATGKRTKKETAPAPLTSLPADYLVCRDRALGHDWDLQQGFKFDRTIVGKDAHDGPTLTRMSRCARCGTQRTEYFRHLYVNEYANKYRVDYLYPKDYHLGGHISGPQIWAEQMRRDKVTEQDAPPAKAPAKRAATKRVTRAKVVAKVPVKVPVKRAAKKAAPVAKKSTPTRRKPRA